MRTAQWRIGRPGALLIVVIGAGWGCAKIIGADFDRPLQQTDGAGGGMPSGGAGGGMTSASSSGAGSLASSASSSASSSVSSSSSGGIDCMVAGDCATKTIYVGTNVTNLGNCPDKATDGLMSDDVDDIMNGGFTPITAFQVFTMPLQNTTPITACIAPAGGKNVATLDGAFPCVVANLSTRTLGYVSKIPISGYEQIREMSNQGFIAFVVENTAYPKVCCHASCNALQLYVPTK
jgi:hypothetical protein